MKKIVPLYFLSILILSCSSQPAPAWQQESFVNMNNFISNFMEGNDKFSESYYKKLVESLQMTTDPDEIVKAHLIKCSLDYSLMNYRTCTEAEPLLDILRKNENTVYYNFISSKNSDIPEKYKDIEKHTSPCDTAKLNKAVKKLDEPLSKLIASSFAVKKDCYDENTLLNAVETASKEGWKKAALSYLTFTAEHFDRKGESEKAENLRKRIDSLNKKD
ncbi:MAG TPA: hypothetical protein PL195_08800 [bacterium]|nr:hypothetical protein [bacterium]